MTRLSVNVNKIALLRNSRGHNFPDLVDFIDAVLREDVRGITVHPRPDERHITRKDVQTIGDFLKLHDDVEFNVEGYPSPEFLELVLAVKPDQVTLVPDAPGQLTSDHGWDVAPNRDLLKDAVTRLRKAGIRTSLFMDPNCERIEQVPAVKADRIELYTESFAEHFGLESEQAIWEQYADAAAAAQDLGLGVNAGHDLNLENLGRFLEIPDILEVSIGHALVVECLYEGLPTVIRRYHEITGV